MRSRVVSCSGRKILNVVAVGLLAGASAACSDSGRFASNPFTNPFSAAATPKVDKVTTGSTRAAPLSPVTAQPLPSALPTAVASPSPRVASATLQNASPIGGSASGWTAAGGTPVTVGAGETANTLSARYGVPVAAITAANGGIIQPGRQAIIPVFAGANAAQAKPGLMQPTPKPAPVAEATPRSESRPEPKVVAPVRPAASAASGEAGPASTESPVASTRRTAAVPLPPQRPAATTPTVQQSAKAGPIKPAKPVTSPDDDDDEDEAPKKIVAAAPKGAQKVAAPAAPTAKPVTVAQAQPQPRQPQQQQAAAPAQPRPQPRVIPLTQQEPKPQAAVEAPRAQPQDPVTTQSIPQTPKTAEAASDKPDFRWPARGRVISGFGSKGGNGDGIAIAVPEGTPVKAAEGGTIAYAGEELKGYGKLVLVRHDNGYVSAYAHNGELNVKRGDKVSRGQTIAKSGATGNVTSPQLHFELRKGSTPVDPTKYLEN
jgi:murein DD-endopeptidase MepM/ murein hydrolase activator NlpD